MQIDCFPDAPSEWLRSTVSDIAEINPPYCIDKQKEYPFLEMAAVAEGFGGILGYDRRKAENTGLCRFKSGDILFGKITPCAENGKVALVEDLPDEFGLGSTEFIVLSPRDGENPNFIYALVCASPFHGRAVSRMEGSTGRLRITQDVFKKWLLVPVPEHEEQNAIVRVLKSADDAIAFAQEELAAARRLKTALMQQLFTKGIPGRHKRFQAVTLGRKEYRIPASWRLRQIKDVLSEPLVNGVSPQSRPDPPGYPILNVSCISDGRCNPALVTYVDVDAATFKTYLARTGDFFVLRGNGNIDYVASGGLLREEPSQPCMFSDLLIRLRFNADVAEGFIPWMWQSKTFLHRLQSKAKSGSGLWKIGLRDIRRESILLPQRDEQEMIVEALETSHQSLDALQGKIDALLRLKKSLLQNLLTGKVRVTTGGEA